MAAAARRPRKWPALFGERLRAASRTPYLHHLRSFFIDTGNLGCGGHREIAFPARA
jgi:hypothetical protein